MRWLPRLALIGAVAAIVFPLAEWMTETFHVDCVRETPAKFGCIVESSKRGGTRLYKLDETSLLSARMDREARYDSQDHTYSYSYYLALVQPKAAIRSNGGNEVEIQAHVKAINAFLTSPEQSSIRFTHNNRTMMLMFAALMVIAVAVFTHDFSYKPKRSD